MSVPVTRWPCRNREGRIFPRLARNSDQNHADGSRFRIPPFYSCTSYQRLALRPSVVIRSHSSIWLAAFATRLDLFLRGIKSFPKTREVAQSGRTGDSEASFGETASDRRMRTTKRWQATALPSALRARSRTKGGNVSRRARLLTGRLGRPQTVACRSKFRGMTVAAGDASR